MISEVCLHTEIDVPYHADFYFYPSNCITNVETFSATVIIIRKKVNLKMIWCFKMMSFRMDFAKTTKNWNFILCLTTLIVRNFLLVPKHLWKTPEMEFSDRVDIVLKKSMEKY